MMSCLLSLLVRRSRRCLTKFIVSVVLVASYDTPTYRCRCLCRSLVVTCCLSCLDLRRRDVLQAQTQVLGLGQPQELWRCHADSKSTSLLKLQDTDVAYSPFCSAPYNAQSTTLASDEEL